jgi:Carbamoyl-phosphate synthase L chain, ATP binding domain
VEVPRVVLETHANVKPTILIAATMRWFSTARLAMALVQAGCTVDVVCPEGHPVTKTKAVRTLYRYRGLTPVTSFLEAIVAAKPDLIIPSDDLSTRHLHEICLERLAGAAAEVSAVIERSLGDAKNFPLLYARTKVMQLAREQGIRVPDGSVVSNLDELREWTTKTGLPAVLKTDGSSGGEGVRVVNTYDEAERAYRKLKSPPGFAKTAKHALIDRDLTLLMPFLLRRRSSVNVQSFIRGREATSLVACWKGAVLAGLHFEVLNKQDSTGPASVLRLIDNQEMCAAAEKMARRLNLSGLHGFDFMIETGTGNTYLIEMNPRATQVGHLPLGPGRDLPAALYGVLAGHSAPELPSITDKDIIALFPQEWTRDAASGYLLSAYHDVPWSEAELIRACVRKQRHWRNLYSQQKWGQVFSPGRLTRL